MALFSVTPPPRPRHCRHLLDLHWLHLPLTAHCWHAVFIPTKSSAPVWTRGAMPVALCTDVGVWHMVALVWRAGISIQCQCPDVSRDAHSLPPEIGAVWCAEHLTLSIVWVVKGCEAGVGGWRMQGDGTRCRTMTSKLCHELPATRALHGLITTWSATEGPFHFLPVTVFHSLAMGAFRGDTLLTPS